MEENGCMGAFFLGADIFLVIGDLIEILNGKATAGDYVSLLCLGVIGVCLIVQYRKDR